MAETVRKSEQQETSGKIAADALGTRVSRGALVKLKRRAKRGYEFAVVVSNDIQNELSDYVLVAPLERRAARLRAPFAVDIGRREGLRDLHTIRCDWVTRVQLGEVQSVERAQAPDRVVAQLETALKVALNLG